MKEFQIMNIFDKDDLGKVLVWYGSINWNIIEIGIPMDCGTLYRLSFKEKKLSFYWASTGVLDGFLNDKK